MDFRAMFQGYQNLPQAAGQALRAGFDNDPHTTFRSGFSAGLLGMQGAGPPPSAGMNAPQQPGGLLAPQGGPARGLLAKPTFGQAADQAFTGGRFGAMAQQWQQGNPGGAALAGLLQGGGAGLPPMPSMTSDPNLQQAQMQLRQTMAGARQNRAMFAKMLGV